MSANRARVTGITVAAVLVLTVAAALYVMGSPDSERERRLDRRRVDELARLSRAVDAFWTRNNRLPANIGEIRQEQGSGFATTDPVTRAPYEYRALTGASFELCATFTMDSAENGPAFETEFWAHRAGRQCFRRAARETR